MIPCKVFLQKFVAFPESQSQQKPKISLTLNNIYYDTIKPFQTKYFCLTAYDVIGVEALEEGTSGQLIVGKAIIENPFKLALQSKPIEIIIKSNNREFNAKEIQLSLSFEPVSLYCKKILQSQQPKGDVLSNNTEQLQLQNSEQLTHLEVSFSQREPIQNSHFHIGKQLKSRQRQRVRVREVDSRDRDHYHDIPLFADSHNSVPEEGESLQSLAQQREKILGQLFGRFKPLK